MRTFYTGIDIGTFNVKVVIAAPAENPEDPMQIIGTGTAVSKGMRHGYIVDRAEATRSVREALMRAQTAAKVTVKSARLALGGVGLDDIRSTGFFNNKAKSLRGLGAAIRDRFGGEVPRTMDDLLTLPGGARKTANCVLGNAYGIAVGVVVDTHVFRLSHRLGLSAGKNPEKVEDDLIDLVPRSEWIDVSHLLILHGRKTCDARKPKCGACVLEDLCPSAEPAAASVGASARPAQPSRVNLRKGNPKKTETRR